jgi:uncharacterized membrane protein
MRFIIFAILCMFLMHCASAAQISGIVYSFDLEKVENAFVTIDTVPKQSMVTKNGTYHFSVPSGNYELTASLFNDGQLESIITENISITTDGSFVLDIILFPDLDSDLEILDELESDILESDELSDELESASDYEKLNSTDVSYLIPLSFYIGFMLLTIVIIVGFLYMQQKRKKPKRRQRRIVREEAMPDISRQVLDFIKSEQGKTTQKEIRKHIPYSEAKISIVLTELEHNGKIERIKKGRSNVIVLK